MVASGIGVYSKEDKNSERRTRRRMKGWAAAQARKKRLVGKRFGHLVVLERYAGSMWLCRCDCGRETYVLGGNLKHGGTQTCGRTDGVWCQFSKAKAKEKPNRSKRWSPEHKFKMSEAAKRRWANIKRPPRAPYMSQEHRLKISIAIRRSYIRRLR